MREDMRGERLAKLNSSAPPWGAVEHLDSIPFGAALTIERFRLKNGLTILVCEDHSAPVVAYHTWYRVGSRHERVGKTGLAHLFEHLMFRQTENLAEGELDRKLEEAGAESNAATWLDWTHYNIAIPREQLGLVVALEAERMAHLVLEEPQVQAEKDVVANERRYRVEDDVESAASELLWATAFERHAYRWPTIGWMADIEGFTTADCADFYRTYYAPNNATVVVVGDLSLPRLLEKLSTSYGALEPSALPVEEAVPEPPQTAERRVEVTKPTATEKLIIGYRSPALGDFDHPAMAVLAELLLGGRASRIHRRLIQELELASDARIFVGPFRDPSLTELFVSARGRHRAEALLEVVDEELARIREEPVSGEELARAQARMELSLVSSLETADGKASTIGFYDTVLGRPAAAFERMEAARAVDASDLRRAARRYLTPEQRSVVMVRAQAGASEETAR